MRLRRFEAKALEDAAESALLAWLTECADLGLPCPTNAAICARFGFSSKASAVRLVEKLILQGDIERERCGNARALRITATGKWTATGGQSAGSRDGVSYGGLNRRLSAARAADGLIEPKAPIQIADRTPCPRCATRADIGCRHQRAGMVA